MYVKVVSSLKQAAVRRENNVIVENSTADACLLFCRDYNSDAIVSLLPLAFLPGV